MSTIMMQDHPDWRSVRLLMINRPEKHNALTLAMWEQLLEYLLQCDADPSVRLVILRGVDDTAFCSGADISEFPTYRANKEQAKLHKQITDRTTQRLATLRPLTLAAISGACFGGGLQLATACDIRLAHESARFAITPVKLGFVYGPYETNLLKRIVGEATAKELLYTGASITAQEALRVGLITKICPNSTILEQFTNQMINSLLQAAPEAQQITKKMFEHLASNDSITHYKALEHMANRALDRPEYREGIQAFLEKRQPHYAQQQKSTQHNGE